MSHYNFLQARLGAIDPEVAANVVNSVFDFAQTLFGKDQVPNYPIKSGNTYQKLIGIVNENVPGPPTSVAHAKELLQKAIDARAWEVANGNGRSANQTIIMMYDEVIRALQAYISKGGGVYVPSTPGSGSGSGTGQPVQTTQDPYFNQGPGLTAGVSTNTLLLIGGAAAVVYFLTRKKGRR